MYVLSQGMARGNSRPEKYLESHNHGIWAYKCCRMNGELCSHSVENPTLTPVLGRAALYGLEQGLYSA